MNGPAPMTYDLINNEYIPKLWVNINVNVDTLDVILMIVEDGVIL